MRRNVLQLLFGMAIMLFSATSIIAQTTPKDRLVHRDLPGSVKALRLNTPLKAMGRIESKLAPSLIGATGPGKVIIRLSAESGADAFGRGADESRARLNARAQQDSFLARVRRDYPNARLIDRVQLVLNAVFIEVDASALPKLALDSAVVRIDRAGDFEMDLTETVPYIGATIVHAAGFDGAGIKVAVLDSGIDYSHAALLGSGNPAEYAANDPNVIETGTFPTAKVVGGYDFVGSNWVGGFDSPPEAPDPDPLDDGPGAGHGTHVGHIIGGVGGVAPGVKLYAVKVCSSISTSCSGIALIQGMEFAVDPNGDGKVNDRVDIVNMSIGSPYGQPFDDDLSTAVDNATTLGVLTVASAGNGADKPYVTGTAGAAPSALSVAQTEMPSAGLQFFAVDAVNYPAIFQPWSAPLMSAIGPAPVITGASAGSALGCSVGSGGLNDTAPGSEPYAAGSLTGKIVLVDRGDCNFSIKIYNIQRGGGLAGIIGLVAPGAPFEGAFGAGGPFTIPGYMISQAHSDAIQAAIASGGASGTLDPNNRIPLVGSVVGSSSRGPQHEDTTLIKPEIGAPGASVSAMAGTGTGVGSFGGTSGAAPMVAGSAALLMQKYGGSSRFLIGRRLAPIETKALLMNNAEINIVNDPLSGALAPITRIGAGEVRVDQAIKAPVAAFDLERRSGALSFGFVDVASNSVTLSRTLRIRNLDHKRRTYMITPVFRFADDLASGAVTISAPTKVDVRPGLLLDTLITVRMTVNGALLPDNYMSSGGEGADPTALTLNEFDGYLLFDDGQDRFQVPWHVLPRKDAQVVPDTTEIIPGSFPQTIGLKNTGVGTAQNDAYSLIAVSGNLPEGGRGLESPTPDIRAVGVNTFPVPAGFCSVNPSFVWAFAINTWERQQHLVPVSHNVYLDINRDGTYDYAVYNFDASLSGSLSDGRQLTFAENLTSHLASAFFYAEHSTNTGNTALLVCAEQVGLTGADLLTTNVDIAVEAFDWYNGGPGDFIDDLTVTPLREQHYGEPADVPGNTYDSSGLNIYDFGPWPGNTPELGLMLFTNGDRGAGNHGGATKDTEALLFLVP